MIKFILQFTNSLGEDYTINFDQKSYSGLPQNLIGTADALVIKSINNDDERFSPILSKECTITFHVPHNAFTTIYDFAATEDDEWNITVYRDPNQPPIFDGYLVVEDSSQPLHDVPYSITLRASDGLPLLKTVPLKQTNGINFLGKNSIVDYIGHALENLKSGVHFRVYYDIYHEDMVTTTSPLEQAELEAKTFEKDERTFLDCYAVLEQIMNDTECRLFYENGCWHVMSLWQYHNTVGYNWNEYYLNSGIVTKVTSANNEVIQANIGKTQLIWTINRDATIYFKVSSKSVKRTFKYNIPTEIVCNQQLQRYGALPNQTIPYDPIKKQSAEVSPLGCWDHSISPSVATGVPQKIVYIYRIFDEFHYETDKYISLPREDDNTNTYLLSTQFPVDKHDRVSFSVDVRIKNNYAGTDQKLVYYAWLRGNDGTKWVALVDPRTGSTQGKWIWYQVPAFSGNVTIGPFTSPVLSFGGGVTVDATDKIEWTTASVDPDNAIPIDGLVQIILIENTPHEISPSGNETWFKNIQIDYKPYINNSFRPASGDFNIYEQDKKVNKSIEEDVNISDSPKPLIKGSLFLNGILATPRWYRLNYNERFRFMQIMTLIKYNFNFKQFHKVEGTLKGLSLYDANNNNIPFGFLPQYSFSDISPASETKYILTSFDCNYVTAQWRGVLVEVQNENPTFNKYDFQYTFQ